MSRSINEGLAAAPLFTPHRHVTAADPALTGDVSGLPGLAASEYIDIIAIVVLASGGTASVQLLIWSDKAGTFLPVAGEGAIALAAGSSAVRFKVSGARFVIYVPAMTGASVDIEVAGVPR